MRLVVVGSRLWKQAERALTKTCPACRMLHKHLKLFGHLVLRQSSLRRGDAQRPGHLEGGKGAAAEALNSPCNGMLTT